MNVLNFIDDSKEELGNEDVNEYSYIVGTYHFKQISIIPGQKFNDICNSNVKQKRRLFTDKNEQAIEQTKIKRMLG